MSARVKPIDVDYDDEGEETVYRAIHARGGQPRDCEGLQGQ
jgi:hypothetical protein